ncbi:MAG: septal ring lytic transglycosylase RlpA family protein [Acetobacteraceae bacterium]
MKRLPALLLGLLPAACSFPPAPPHPHYALGTAYQADGVWHYPRRQLDAVATGLAAVAASDHPPLTADGEAFDQDALAAGSPSLQLPAIARLTNLANGRQVEVRINDRGPADPGRLVVVTRRVANLLGIPQGGTTPVRLDVLPGPSQAAEAALPGAPALAMAALPVGAVTATALGPAGGASVDPTRIALAPVAPAPAAPAPVAPDIAPPDRPAPAGGIVPALSGQVTQSAPVPTALWVRLDSFIEYQYAAMLTARLAGLHPVIRREIADGEEQFVVRIGPFVPGVRGVAAADATLRQAIRAGAGDARIVVEQE